jgi:hypothetical protein
MRKSISSTLLILAALLPAYGAAMEAGFNPPLAIFYDTEFSESSPVPEDWEINAGTWSVASGSYNSTTAAAVATSTMFQYIVIPFDPPRSEMFPPYVYRARVRNQRAGATNLAGVVFDYIDAANYVEAVFSPTGTLSVRQVRDGTATTLASATYSGGGQNVWFDVELIREETTAQVRANGVGGVTVTVGTPPEGGGRLGLTTRNTTARFDKVSIAIPFGAQPFKEDFSSGSLSRWLTTGQWSIAGGTLNNTSVQQTSTARTSEMSIQLAADSVFFYMLRARMLNPYGGPGNLVGMYFNHDGESRGEVLFSPRGVARIDLIRDGVTETIATAPYPGRRNEWFDVRADISAGSIDVAVNGIPIFENIATGVAVIEGAGGLITHWAPGKFDDVWFDNRNLFEGLSQPFDSAPPAAWIVSGSWKRQRRNSQQRVRRRVRRRGDNLRVLGDRLLVSCAATQSVRRIRESRRARLQLPACDGRAAVCWALQH